MIPNVITPIFFDVIRIVIAVSILFVWIVRYDNIVQEFKTYKFPHWFRDSMGILKCTAATFLLIGSTPLVGSASVILLVLMLSAFIVHIKHSHTLIQMVPSLSLSIANAFLLYQLIS